VASAEPLAVWLDGREHPAAQLFDTRRLRLRAGAVKFLEENLNVALRFFGDRVMKRVDVDSIEPGEGRMVGAGLGQGRGVPRRGGRAGCALRTLHTWAAS
jgi:hypothetical protein